MQAECGCVTKLTQLITAGFMDLTIEATGALALIVVVEPGKEALLAAGEALLFVELLDWLDLTLERNVLSIITNAAVHPTLRQSFVVRAAPAGMEARALASWALSKGWFLQEAGVLPELRKIQKSESPTIRHACAEAYRRCVFQHRPLARAMQGPMQGISG